MMIFSIKATSLPLLQYLGGSLNILKQLEFLFYKIKGVIQCDTTIGSNEVYWNYEATVVQLITFSIQSKVDIDLSWGCDDETVTIPRTYIRPAWYFLTYDTITCHK